MNHWLSIPNSVKSKPQGLSPFNIFTSQHECYMGTAGNQRLRMLLSWTTSNNIIVFFRNYTTLADLAFLYCLLVKSKINSSKNLPPMGIEPATLGLLHLLCLHFHALTTRAKLASVSWGICYFICLHASNTKMPNCQLCIITE